MLCNPKLLCNEFSTSPSLKHRQILLGRGALCTLLAKRLICVQNAVAIDDALNHARAILKSTFLRGISWFSLPSFYVRIVKNDNSRGRRVMNAMMLEVRPGDSIQNVTERIFATMHLISLDRISLYASSTLEPSNRVCDYGFIRPHTTLHVSITHGAGG